MAEPTPNLPAETEDRPWLTDQISVLDTIAERRKVELQNSSNLAPQEQPVPTQQPQPEQRFLEDGLDTTFVHRKIDGRDEAISIADLLATSQMDGAAANRLAQAKALKDEWARKVQELEHHQPEPQAPTLSTSQRQDPDKMQALRNILNAWGEGEEELPVDDVNALFGNTPTRQPAVNIDPAEIAQQVRTQFEVDDGLVTYQTNYADIASDPFLDAKAATLLEQAMQTGLSFKQALLESAEQTRQWVREKAGLPAPSPTPNPTTAQSQREQARANLRTMPVANARVDTSTPAPMTLEEHRRQRINELRNN